jgi:hypothetical protein
MTAGAGGEELCKTIRVCCQERSRFRRLSLGDHHGTSCPSLVTWRSDSSYHPHRAIVPSLNRLSGISDYRTPAMGILSAAFFRIARPEYGLDTDEPLTEELSVMHS